MAAHNITGQSGEMLAAHRFEQQGYQILECNWRTGHLEIDLIAAKDNTIYFIEVKTTHKANYGYPEEMAEYPACVDVLSAPASP